MNDGKFGIWVIGPGFRNGTWLLGDGGPFMAGRLEAGVAADERNAQFPNYTYEVRPMDADRADRKAHLARADVGRGSDGGRGLHSDGVPAREGREERLEGEGGPGAGGAGDDGGGGVKYAKSLPTLREMAEILLDALEAPACESTTDASSDMPEYQAQNKPSERLCKTSRTPSEPTHEDVA